MQNEDRRSINDRRHEMLNVLFPLRCSNNSIILTDRRVRCERRIERIKVSESEISREEFMTMLRCRYGDTSVGYFFNRDIEDIEIFDSCIIKD